MSLVPDHDSSFHLLILGCSQRKRPEPGPLPALERYDGPAYRVLRRFLRGSPEPSPRVLVLSAEFGLIAADREIPWYDRRLDAARAAALEPEVREALREALAGRQWSSIFLHLGGDYLAALGGPENFRAAPAEEVLLAQGPPGLRLSQLRGWLQGEPPAQGRRAPRRLQ